MTLSVICQWSAFVSLFVAYILLLLGVFKPKNWLYLCLQLIGGVSFILVGLYTKVWSIWAFNGIWVVTTLSAMILKVIKSKKSFTNI